MSIPTTALEYILPKAADGLDALVIRKAEVSSPKPTEVLLKVEAASLNYRDLIVARYGEGQGRKDDFIPLSDAAGIVVAVGSSATKFSVGQRVSVNMVLKHISGKPTREMLNSVLGGGNVDGVLTQYRVFPEEAITLFPNHLSFEEASTLPCAGATAWQSLYGTVPLKAGDTILIQGTGGVALFALQFAVAAGAIVIMTSSSDEKLKFVKGLGAKHTINYKTNTNWHETVLELTENHGVDHVVELGGSGTLMQSIKATAFGGDIHVVGVIAGGGDLSGLPVQLLMSSINLHGVGCASLAQFKEMNEFISVHGIKPVIDKVFEFEQAKEAFDHLVSQKHVGNIVIKV